MAGASRTKKVKRKKKEVRDAHERYVYTHVHINGMRRRKHVKIDIFFLNLDEYIFFYGSFLPKICTSKYDWIIPQAHSHARGYIKFYLFVSITLYKLRAYTRWGAESS